MYHSEVYNIMIGSPSDIQEEVNTAINVINRWNYVNSESENIVLMPLHWSFSSYPTCGVHPQKSINKQLVSKSDLMISIFGARMGTPTDTEISGTVEEINKHLDAGKDVMVFFKLSIDDISSIDTQQLQKIKDFKESIKDRVLWCEFTNNEDFEKIINEKIQLFVNVHWKNTQVFNPILPSRSSQLQLSDEEKQRLVVWTNEPSAESVSFSFNRGYLYRLGYKQYEVNEGRENAEWEDFFKRLRNADFIELEKYNKEGRPIYKLLKAAYDYVDTLDIKQDNPT